MENTTENIQSSNFPELIKETINSIFSDLFSSIDNSIFSILDDITFINSDILNDSYFQNIFGTSSSNGILLIANSILIGFVLYYAVNLLFSHFSYLEIQKPNQYIFRIIIFVILMNSSYFICEQILNLNSFITLAIRQVGETTFGKDICFSTLIKEINKIVIIDGNNFNIFSLDGLIKSFISISLFSLAFTYSLRYIMLKVFILICPFAILSLINKNTIWIFKSWLKIILSLLFFQIFISLILLIIFSINYLDDLFSKLLYIGGIYALIKANQFMREFMGGLSTNINSNLFKFKNFFGGK